MSRNSSPHLVATPGEQGSLPPSRSASPIPVGNIAGDFREASASPINGQEEWLGLASELKSSSANRLASAPRPSTLSQSILADEGEDIQIGPSSIPQSPLQPEEQESSPNEDASDEDFDIRGERKTRGQTRGRGRPRKRGASERGTASQRRAKEEVTPTKTTNGLLAPPSSQTRSRSRSPSAASATSGRDKSPAAEEGSIPSAHFFQSTHQPREMSRSPSIASAAAPLQEEDEAQKQQQPPLKRKRGRPRKRQPEPSTMGAEASLKQSEGSDSSSELSSPPVESERFTTTKKKRRVSPSTDDASSAAPPHTGVKELSFTQKLRKDIGLSSDSDISEPAERATSLPVSAPRGKGKASRGGKKANASASASAKRQSREQTRAEQEEKRQKALTTAVYEQELLDSKRHPLYIQLMDTIEEEQRLRMEHAKAWLDISLKEVDFLADAQSRSVLRQWQEDNRSMRSDLIEECQRIQRTVHNNYFDPYKMLCPHSNPPELSGVYLPCPGSDTAWRDQIGTEPRGLSESDITADFAYMGFTVPDAHSGDRSESTESRNRSESTPSAAPQRQTKSAPTFEKQSHGGDAIGRQLKASPPDPHRSAGVTAPGVPSKSLGVRNIQDLPPPVFHAKHRPQPAFAAAAAAEAGPSTAPKASTTAPKASPGPKPISDTFQSTPVSAPALKASIAAKSAASSKPVPSSSSHNAVVSFPPQPRVDEPHYQGTSPWSLSMPSPSQPRPQPAPKIRAGSAEHASFPPQPPVAGPSHFSDGPSWSFTVPMPSRSQPAPKAQQTKSAEDEPAKRGPATNQYQHQHPPPPPPLPTTETRPPHRAWQAAVVQEPLYTSQQQQQQPGVQLRQPGSSQMQHQPQPKVQAQQLPGPMTIGASR